MKHLAALNKYFYKYRKRYIAGLLFVVISNYFALLAPQITAYVVDKVQQVLPGYVPRPLSPQVDPLVRWFVAWVESGYFDFNAIIALCGISILVLALIRGGFMYLMRQTIIVASRYIEYEQKNEVYRHFQELDSTFYKKNSTGDLMNRLSEDVGRVRMYTGPSIMYLANLLTMIILSVYYMVKKDAELTLYVLAPLPLLSITIYFVNTIIHKRSLKIQGILSNLTTNAQQTYSGIRVVKSYAQERNMLSAFEENSEQYRKESISLAKVEAFYSPAMWLLIGLSTLVTIMIGGIYYLNGKITEVGTLVEFVMYINMLMFPVMAIGWVAGMVQRAAASQSRLNDLLQTRPDVSNTPQTAESPDIGQWSGTINFDKVSFRYPNTGILAIDDFSLTIRAGEKIAVVGSTGSGKSTLGQLLLRMYNTSTGTIYLDNQTINSFDLQALRSAISYVPQEVFLFSDTIAGNISFGNNDAAEAEIKEAAAMASVAGEIEQFEKGYETIVGERGVTLSGGQKQRVSIARALLKPAKLIVFDDCLSAVDAATEKAVLEELGKYLADKTAIVITHRIFALLDFDVIVVMEEGQIVEKGTHAQLLEKNGLYAELYRRQQFETAEVN